MIKFFKGPPAWFLAIVYIFTLACIVGSLVILITGIDNIFSYIVYALAAMTLAYTVYTLVRFMPKIKASVKAIIEKNSLTRKYVRDFGFRSFISTVISFSVSIFFSIFTGVLGIMASSVWYGSLSLYYILLTSLYGCVIINRKREENQYKIYRLCGILLMILNSALSVAIAQMIFKGEGFEYGELMIYVYATYAFYKITVAIVRLSKLGRKCEPIAHATALINLTGGMVSVLALQTALLSTFGDGVNSSLFNTLTGSLVSVSAICISIFMIIKGTKNINLEKTNER